MIHTPRTPAGPAWTLCVMLVFAASGACTSTHPDAPVDARAGSIEFSNIRVEEIAATRAVVRFDTSVPATCEIEFGTTAEDLTRTATDPDMAPGELATDHDVALEDLQSETTYYFRAKATDADGFTGYSEIGTFTTKVLDDPTAGLVNVALVAEGTWVVDVSSNWANGANSSSYGIHSALDGADNTSWSSNGDGDDAYVVLNFGQPRTITHFAYRSREMGDGTSIVTRVQLLVDGGAVVFGPYDTPDFKRRYVFALPEVLTVEEIRFEVVDSTGGNTGAREIQFFAAPAGP